MTWRQFEEWKVFANLEPFAPERLDQLAATICQAIFEQNRNRKRRPKPFTWQEFALQFGDHPPYATAAPAKTWEEQKQMGQMMAAMFGAFDKKKG
jgi:hypothetical protein